MALNPLGPVARQLRSLQFRRSPEFDAAVTAAEKLAAEQNFCSPLDYARSRAGNGFASPRELTTWRAVHERLRKGEGTVARDDSGPSTVPLAAEEPVAAASAAPEATADADLCSFAVTLTTEVGPGSPAARLSALADAHMAAVTVRMDRGEPVLVYSLPSRLAAPAFSALRVPA